MMATYVGAVSVYLLDQDAGKGFQMTFQFQITIL